MTITVVTPVSPILSHPEIDILSETVASVRHHIPDAELFLLLDGVRAEQEARRADYEESIRRALWTADKAWGGVVPYLFDTHRHQVAMLRAVLDQIRTPLLLFVEQDTPLVTDELIDWNTICQFILDGNSNLVRLHHEAVIPAEHKHMIHGYEDDGRFLRTSQFSARPHVASVAYYRRILEAHFSPEAKCFTEDVMHGVVDEAFRIDGIAGWNQHRIHIYDPGNGNMKRSLHLDGRAGEPKLDDTQVF